MSQCDNFDSEEINDFKTSQCELDEYHPRATKTLFVGNLDKDITKETLDQMFREFGEIVVSRRL